MANKSSAGSTLLAVLAIILILLGLIFLFRNFSLLPWGLWGTMWRLWPVLLVVMGIYIILGHSRPGLAAILSLITILLAFIVSWVSGGQTVSGSFSEPLGSLEKAEVVISFGNGELTLDSLPATSAELAKGDFKNRGLIKGLSQHFKREGGLGKLELNAPLTFQHLIGGFPQSWQVKLTPRIPLELTISVEEGRGQLNLTDLRVTRLRLDMGASQATINLPKVAPGTIEALINAGAADLTIVVPQGMAAQIKPNPGLASFKIDERRFPKTGDYYATPGFAGGTANRINLEISSDLAKVEVR